MRNVFEYIDGEHLEHHGIKGQKWGIRRFQNPDGSLTDAGKARYLKENGEFDYSKRNSSKEATEIFRNYYDYNRKKYINEIESIVNMPKNTAAQRAEKAAKEKEILEGWDEKNKNRSDYGLLLDRSVALQHLIEAKSVDWYMSKPVTKSAEKLLKDLDKLRSDYNNKKFSSWSDYNAQREKLYEKVDSVILKDIGFEDTPENRELIRWYWHTD